MSIDGTALPLSALVPINSIYFTSGHHPPVSKQELFINLPLLCCKLLVFEQHTLEAAQDASAIWEHEAISLRNKQWTRMMYKRNDIKYQGMASVEI
jgi:hypothetical protein